MKRSKSIVCRIVPAACSLWFLLAGVQESLAGLVMEIDTTAKTLTFTGTDSGSLGTVGTFSTTPGSVRWILGGAGASSGHNLLTPIKYIDGFETSLLDRNDGGGIQLKTPTHVGSVTLTGQGLAFDYSGLSSAGFLDSFGNGTIAPVGGPFSGFSSLTVTTAELKPL